MPETQQHYSDYGFDPQLNFFQALEEAMEYAKGASPQSPDALHFKLKKPPSTDEQSQRAVPKKRGWRRWAYHFLFWTKGLRSSPRRSRACTAASPSSYPNRAVSGPLCMTESGLVGATPAGCMRWSSGPLRGTSNIGAMNQNGAFSFPRQRTQTKRSIY